LGFALKKADPNAEFIVNVQTSKNSGYRTFLDARGRVWEVWMVHPSSIERRKMERRSPVENAVFLIEQRVLGDRRTQHGGTRGNVASEYSNGWLCFASDGEKRRLAPVPVNWMSANDSQIAEWLRIAYGRKGVRVSCLCPQSVQTDMTRDGNGSAGIHGVLTPEQVAEVVVQTMREERFLALPHPEVAKYFLNKAQDYDRWLGGMQKLYAHHMGEPRS